MLGKIDVEIGGKTRHLTFGQNAWYLFTKMKGITPDKIRSYMGNQLEQPETFRDLIYCSMQVDNLRNGLPIDFNVYDVGDWIDQADPNDTAKIIVCIFESLAIPTEGIKKKLGLADEKK